MTNFEELYRDDFLHNLLAGGVSNLPVGIAARFVSSGEGGG